MDGLRAGWKQLSKLAEDARCQLLSEQRLVYERELDKQVQAFTVETIQFRNSFDTEGPLVSGLTPMEAVGRLGMKECERGKKEEVGEGGWEEWRMARVEVGKVGGDGKKWNV